MTKSKQESLYSSPAEGFTPAFRRPGLSTETRRKLQDSGKLNAPPHRKPKRAKRDEDEEVEVESEEEARPAGRRASRQVRRIKRGRLVKRSVRLPIDVDDELLDMVEEDGSTLTDTLKTIIHAEWVRRRRAKRRRRPKKASEPEG